MSFLLPLSLLTGGALFAVAVVTGLRRRAAPELPPAGAAPADGEVVVLLPVRDEERNLLPCLDTLLAQTVRPRVLVIDDGSRDATRRLAEERAAGEPRLEVISAGELPPGWGGKIHALHAGHVHLLRRRGGPPRWVLSTDADTRHHPELLARALAATERWELDAVSVAGHQAARGAAENLLTPVVFALLDLLLGDWELAAEAECEPVANGQFILLREEALRRAGGFAAIRGRAIDDVALARRLDDTGSRVGFLRAQDLLRVRMYRGFGAVLRGWRRNLGGLFGPRPGRAALTLIALVAAPAVLVADLATGSWWAAAGLWFLGASASSSLRGTSGHHPAWALLFPLDALLLALTLALGVVDWHRGELAAWKGRSMEAR